MKNAIVCMALAASGLGSGASSPTLAGKWQWGAGQVIVELDPDGTGRDPRNTVRWSATAERTYVLRWSHGYTDTVTLSPDGASLAAVNNTGFRFTATRIGPVGPSSAEAARIAGQWDWGAGGTVVDIDANGTGRDPRNTMQWTSRDPAAGVYVLRWSHGYTDTATLSADGNTISAVNNTGLRFTATRRRAVPPPAGPLDLNGVWSGGLLHIWQDGSDVLVTASWKRADGKYVIWRGEGKINGRAVDLAIRYSPMPHGDRGVWRGAFTVSADGNAIDATYSLGGAIQDRQHYVRER